MMKVLRAIWSKLHIYVTWALMSAIFWGWIFTLVTDVPDRERVTVFVYAPACRETELDVELEKSMPKGIRQVRAHLFSYALFEEDELLNADIYVLPGTEAAKMSDSFRPLPAELAQGDDLFFADGAALGLPVNGAASEWVTYPGENEGGGDYYLFFGVNSIHYDDGAAQTVAEAFLTLP